MKLYKNSKNNFVTLTGKTATNKYGTKFLWVRCENGAVVSITESDFNAHFKSA